MTIDFEDSMIVSLRLREGDRLPLSAFGEIVVKFNTLLETVERELSKDGLESGFELSRLQSSHPTIWIAPVGNEPKAPVFEATIDAITAASTDKWQDWPQNLTSSSCVDGFRAALRAALVDSAGVECRYRDRSVVATDAVAKVVERWSSERKLIDRSIPGWGRVEGRLDSINVHSRMVFSVWRASDGQRFECELDESQFDKARLLLRKHVGVEGLVTDSGLTSGSKITPVSSIDEIDDSSQADTVELFGSIPDLMGEMDADEYWGIVRGNRRYAD